MDVSSPFNTMFGNSAKSMASMSGPSSSGSGGIRQPQLTPQLSSLEQQLFSPMSTGSLPFLSLDPPPEPDDYLFALEPYEGATELFDMYVGASANASGNGNGPNHN